MIHNSIYLGDELAKIKRLCASTTNEALLMKIEQMELEREEAAAECRRHWLVFDNGEEDGY